MTRPRLGVAHVGTLFVCSLVALGAAGCLAHERDPGCDACDGGVSGDADLHGDAGRDAASAEDGGLDAWGGDDAGPDSGWCECPMPPPGCTYDGVPCSCSHMTCVPEHCGRDVCAEGTFCCNSTCSTCVPPGVGCVDIACAPDCTPMDAHSNGRCSLTPGYAWDGTACRPLSCSCLGTECDALFATEADCLAYFGACPTFFP